MDEMFGWYSEKQATRFGTRWYEGVDGKTVEVSSVSPTETHTLGWDDAVPRGRLVRYVRKGREGSAPRMPSFKRIDPPLYERWNNPRDPQDPAS